MDKNENIENFNGFKFVISYDDIIEENCKELADKISNQAKSKWGNKSPYAKSWTFKMKKYNGEKYGVVYNKKHYRLTHLLEFGHAIWNSKTGKKFKGYEHIGNNFRTQKTKFIKDMEKAKIE